jgi:hypothetical protein
MALLVATPAMAASLAQESVDEVVVTSATAFTLTVRIDEVTTLAIPLQVGWRAEGPSAANANEVVVTFSPTVLRTGFFSVTVGAVEPATGTLAITLTQPVEDVAPVTRTTTTTATTAPATPTTPITATTPATTTGNVPANAATTNTVSNLRAGPGTDYPIVGSADAGSVLDIVGQNADGTWLILANGSWIAAFLVNNAPQDLPVVEPPAAPAPTPAATEILTPTVIPTVTPTP